MENKKEIRKRVMLLRDRLTEAERLQKGRSMEALLFGLSQVKEAETLFFYASFGSEAPTWNMIGRALSEGRRVALPKVEGKRMRFYGIKDVKNLRPGPFGILEPPAEGVELTEAADCLIMPGVAFDPKRARIGYGGGYYDRYLSSYRPGLTVALAFECQILSAGAFLAEPHDIRPARIVTELRVL